MHEELGRAHAGLDAGARKKVDVLVENDSVRSKGQDFVDRMSHLILGPKYAYVCRLNSESGGKHSTIKFVDQRRIFDRHHANSVDSSDTRR